jgi:hypothetical protein
MDKVIVVIKGGVLLDVFGIENYEVIDLDNEPEREKEVEALYARKGENGAKAPERSNNV